MSRDVGQIGADLSNRWVAPALGLVVKGPPKSRSRRGLEEKRDALGGLRTDAPPRRNAGRDVAVLHGPDVAGDDRAAAAVVVAQRWVVVRERVHSLLVPGLG